MKNDETKNLINTITKALTLAMGVAVLALSIMKAITVESAISLLALGLCACGISLFNK